MQLIDSYPTALQKQVRLAARLTHTISLMGHRVGPDDPAFFWMLGRPDEVRAVVSDVTREWSQGHLDAFVAARLLGDYLRGLTRSLAAVVSEGRAPSRPSGHPPRRDTIADV
jgi:hypothetical protein